MAVCCVCLFVTVALLAVFDVLGSGLSPIPYGRVVQIVSFHSVAFLVVGLLASRLADRQMSGEQLREATKSLQNLRALHERIIESIRSGLITTDLDGRIFTFNAAAAEITGYRAEEVNGRAIFTLFSNPDDFRLKAEGAADGQARSEADIITPDGFRVRIGYTIADLYSEENEASGYIVTFQDLTQIRSMEESIRRKDRLAAVGRVGAGLAHEIRNPLGAMRGAIQVLESSMPPNSVQTDLMGIVLRESDRLNSIITNFLSYAKPKVGNLAEIDLREAVGDTIKLLRHSPDVTEKHVLEEHLPQVPVFVSADQTQMQQVFWNLARNALQAMPEGGRLHIRVQLAPNQKVRIIFEDTGRGMPPEQVEQLFEPFSTSTTGGTGLGLSIVYQIIRDHNGSINVRSVEEEGTTITIELPVNSQAIAGTNGDRSPIEAYLNVKNSENELSS
jgi:two-component system sensor histidine kinase PilS (NtrC family)